MKLKKRILVAPLNWGLGHATRCIPLINELVKHNFEPIIASDGAALDLLKKEFPNCTHIELPSYNITYSKHPKFFNVYLFFHFLKILKAVKAEQKLTNCIVNKYSISGIISDNRFGVRHTEIPSVYITHQLQVLSGIFTWFTSKFHQKLIKSYDECWIPDTSDKSNLSGDLSQFKINSLKIKYLGIISRLTKFESEKLYDILVILSGPEPQRSLLEHKIIEAFKNYKGSILLVLGKISDSKPKHLNHIKIINYMTTSELEKAISSSDLIIARSGYSTLLDLAKLKKKAFFIPTPGQNEQEYLARRLDFLKIAPYCSQKEFQLGHLKRIDEYKGFEGFNTNPIDFSKLLSLF